MVARLSRGIQFAGLFIQCFVRSRRSVTVVCLLRHPIQIEYAKDLIGLLCDDRDFSVLVSSPTEEWRERIQESMCRKILWVPYAHWVSRLPVDLLLGTCPGKDLPAHEHAQKVCFMHSLVSVHSVYRPDYFLGYDHIFCAGPHHIAEFRSRLPGVMGTGTKLWPVGYEPTDRLVRNTASSEHKAPREAARAELSLGIDSSRGPLTVLYAPTWGPSSSLSEFGLGLFGVLLAEFRLIFRPHPLLLRDDSEIIESILEEFGEHLRLQMDLSPDPREAFDSADVMLSDWSGVAFEFALGLGKPVFYIGTCRKTYNKDGGSESEGVEVTLREAIGTVCTDVAELPRVIGEKLNGPSPSRHSVQQLRDRLLFNCGESAKAALSALRQMTN